jgi:hypothetical protein
MDLLALALPRLGSWLRSLFGLTLWIEWLRNQFSVCLFQEDLDFAFRFFKLLLAFARKFDAFLEKLHGVIERKLRRFQPAHDFFQTTERFLEIGFLRRLGFFNRCCIQSCLKILLRSAN